MKYVKRWSYEKKNILTKVIWFDSKETIIWYKLFFCTLNSKDSTLSKFHFLNETIILNILIDLDIL